MILWQGHFPCPKDATFRRVGHPAAVEWDRGLTLLPSSELLFPEAAASVDYSNSRRTAINTRICFMKRYAMQCYDTPCRHEALFCETPGCYQRASAYTKTRHILHRRNIDSSSIKPADFFGREFAKRLTLAGLMHHSKRPPAIRD
jgi:hypothetical protein